jgi:hypothetical protein
MVLLPSELSLVVRKKSSHLSSSSLIIDGPARSASIKAFLTLFSLLPALLALLLAFFCA